MLVEITTILYKSYYRKHFADPNIKLTLFKKRNGLFNVVGSIFVVFLINKAVNSSRVETHSLQKTIPLVFKTTHELYLTQLT